MLKQKYGVSNKTISWIHNHIKAHTLDYQLMLWEFKCNPINSKEYDTHKKVRVFDIEEAIALSVKPIVEGMLGHETARKRRLNNDRAFSELSKALKEMLCNEEVK